MNFFGHSVAASWRSPSPEFTFGAMLPDFSTILGTRFESTDPTVAAGVDYHHLTDAAFHKGVHFVAQQRAARKRLRALGVRRGPQLAVAHIGVELLLDTALAEQPAHHQHYAQVVRLSTKLSTRVRLKRGAITAPEVTRLCEFLNTLHQQREAVAASSPSEVALRLERILRGRSALALSPAEVGLVTTWAIEVWDQVRATVPDWMLSLRGALEATNKQAKIQL